MASIPTLAELEYQELHIKDDMAPNIIATSAVCLTIACIAVALRFQARRVARIKYELDDWLIVVGLVRTHPSPLAPTLRPGLRLGKSRREALSTDSLLAQSRIHTWNRHLRSSRRPLRIWETCHSTNQSSDVGKGTNNFALEKSQEIATFTDAVTSQLLLSGEVIYGPAVSAIKGSLLYLYHRVFFVSRRFTIALWIVGIFVICYCLTQSFASIFQCMPIDSTWKIGVKHYCVNTDLGATIIAGFNALTDFAILILPMPLLYKLQKPLKEKLQIMGIFCLGGLVCFASIYRCILTHEFSHTDPSWSDTRPEIWTVVELCIGILSACLPTMRPLFSRKRGRHGSEPEQVQEKSESLGHSDQSLSVPSESKRFAHLGVLADVERVQEVEPERW